VWKPLVAAAMLLLLTTPAYAAPPPSTLCPGLTGDALSRCLYSDLDDRLRGVVPTTAPTTAAPTTAPPATGDWLSGASGTQAANGTFGTWRGSPVEIGTTWVNDPALYPIGPKISGCGGCGEWAGFAGPLSISASPSNWQGWAAEAGGANDTFWTQLARNARTLRAGKGQVYLNPYYEFNGDWMPYSVARTTQGQADFQKAFARTSAILRKEFPGVKVVINPAAGRTVPDAMWPAPSAFDVVGIDTYNEWPFCGTASCTGTQISRVEVLRLQAAARSKPIAFPEWGNSAVASSAGGGGESPAFIDAFHGYLSEHAGTGAGQVLYETYFNITGYTQRFELYPNTAQPQTAARYVQRF
jgi:hypothetical protein